MSDIDDMKRRIEVLEKALQEQKRRLDAFVRNVWEMNPHLTPRQRQTLLRDAALKARGKKENR